MRLVGALYSLAVALWVGAALAIGYIAAPVLFATLADRTLAGTLAGRMFDVTSWLGLACGGYLLLYLLFQRGWRVIKSGVFWIVLTMLALTVAGHLGIQPILEKLRADALPRQVMESAMRDRFATWHGISSIIYLIQSLLGVWLVVWQERGKSR